MKKVLIIIIFLSFAATAHATTYYVATTGSDSNPGTAALPFLTIQKASNSTSAGDTVIVNDGVYTVTPASQNPVVLLNNTGTPNAWITYKSAHKWGAVIDGQNNQVIDGFSANTNASYIVIKDFSIQGFSDAGINLNSTGNSNFDITGNDFHDIGRMCTSTPFGIDGTYVNHNTSHVTYEDNIFERIGRLQLNEQGCGINISNHDHSVYLSAATSTFIFNNIFRQNVSGWGVQVSGASGTNTDIVILNNTFIMNNPNQNGDIILYNPDGAGFSDVTIANNIFYQPNGEGIRIGTLPGMSQSTVIENNITFGASTSNDIGPGITFFNNQNSTDPQLNSTTTGNYLPNLGSPAINAGISTSTVLGDFFNVPRNQGPGIDIGAFEYPYQEDTIVGNVTLQGNVSIQ